MEIKIKFCLDRYNPLDIIDWVESGILTLDEVVESKVVYSKFSDVLEKYIHAKLDERFAASRAAEQPTIITE